MPFPINFGEGFFIFADRQIIFIDLSVFLLATFASKVASAGVMDKVLSAPDTESEAWKTL